MTMLSLATVAQQEEKLIRNQQDAGSSPASSSKTKSTAMAVLFVLETKFVLTDK